MAKVVSKRVLDELMGEKNVTMLFMDDGTIFYITKPNSLVEIAPILGACRMVIKGDDKKQVFFLLNKNSSIVGKYLMHKELHGFSTSEIFAQRALLCFFKSWSVDHQEWVPCVSGKLDHNCIVKEWKGIRTVYNNNKWYIECANLINSFYIVPPGKYDYIDDFNESGLARVRIDKCILLNNSTITNERWGIVNVDGEEIIPAVYSSIVDVSCGKWRKVFKLCKYEDNSEGNTNRIIREFFFDYYYYSCGVEVELLPVEDWFYEKDNQSLLSIAKGTLSEEDYLGFELSLIKRNKNERLALHKIWTDYDALTKEEKLKNIVRWDWHWLNLRDVFVRYDFEYAKDHVSEYAKILYFWVVFLEEKEKHPEELNFQFQCDNVVYSEDNLQKLVKWYNNYYEKDIDAYLLDEGIEKKSSSYFQRIDKNDCVVRKTNHNNEIIYEVSIKDGSKFYYKNVRSLKDVFNSFGDNLRNKLKITPTSLIIDEECYYFNTNIKGRPLYEIAEKMEFLEACSCSKDLVEWKNIIEVKLLLSIGMNPVSIVSDKRIVTEDNFGKWGVLDLLGNIIVPMGKYAKIDGFKYNLAKVKRINTAVFFDGGMEDYYDTYGIIDVNGNEVLPPIYDEVWKFYGSERTTTTVIKDKKIVKMNGCVSETYTRLFFDLKTREFVQNRRKKRFDRPYYLDYEDSINNDTSNDYSVWDALEDDPEAAGNIDYEM